MRRYQDVAIRTAYLVAPEADAADAVQDAFVKAYAALPRFRDGAPFRPWLLRIVANEGRNRRRSAGPTGRPRGPGRHVGTGGVALRPPRPRPRSSPARRRATLLARSAASATRTAR